MDVVESDRPAIFRHIVERFGEPYTARVGAYGTLAELATIDATGNALRKWWEIKHHPENFADAAKRTNWSAYKFDPDNPYLLKKIDAVKKSFSSDPDATRKRYTEIFYYYDGLYGTKSSQSVHPAGIIISPIDLDEEYGVFMKDGERCLTIDMEELHEVGAAKYDFLILKTVEVIRDTCQMIGIPYPRSHEVDWNDQAVWADMITRPEAIFQMESAFAFECLKRFQPHSIFDMSLVTACIRPSGTSYRDDLLAKRPHHNPSRIIDELLSDNLGYLIYQEDTIKFLQQICGLSGSEADNIRRAIGRKQRDRLEAALPSILEGYCSKSDKPRAEAEAEAKEFLQVIEDSASYQFGYNHSVAYCLLGYLCAYYRYYHPVEFITAFLNNAANDDDITNGTRLAQHYKIQISSPKFGVSRGEYACDPAKRRIAKGLASVKFLSAKMARDLYRLSQSKTYACFTDLLFDIAGNNIMDSRQLSTLIHIDFFSDFGNQRELENVVYFFDLFKKGEAKQIRKDRIAGSFVEEIVSRHGTDRKKDGTESSSWKLDDVPQIIRECEKRVLSIGLKDFGVITKTRFFTEAMGYSGFISGRPEDRIILYVRQVFPLRRKKDDKLFGHCILTTSLGSGIEGRFTIFNREFDADPIKPGDIIKCLGFRREKGKYFTMLKYRHVYTDDDSMEDLEDESQ